MVLYELVSEGSYSPGSGDVIKSTDSPYGYGFVDPTLTVISTSPGEISGRKHLNLKQLMHGTLGRQYVIQSLPGPEHTQCKLTIHGGPGSGKKSLAIAIATILGRPYRIVDGLKNTSSYVFGTDGAIIKKVTANSQAGVVSIVVNLGKEDSEELKNNRNAAWEGALKGISDLPYVIICTENNYSALVGRKTYSLKKGQAWQIREWLLYHHPSLTADEVAHISRRVAHLAVQPAHIARASGTNAETLLQSIRNHIVGDDSLTPKAGECRVEQWKAHLESKMPLLRPAAAPLIVSAETGVILWGPGGTGKTYALKVAATPSEYGTVRYYALPMGEFKERMDHLYRFLNQVSLLHAIYEEKAPAQVLHIDEAESLLDSTVFNDTIKAHTGSESSPKLFIGLTLNVDPSSRVVPELMRSGRLTEIHVGYVERYEWNEVLPMYDYVPGVSYQDMLLVAQRSMGGTRDFYEVFYEVLKLPYTPEAYTDDPGVIASRVASIPSDSVMLEVSDLINNQRKVRTGELLNRPYYVSSAAYADLARVVDHVFRGARILPKLAAYALLSPSPWVVCVVSEDSLQKLETIEGLPLCVMLVVVKIEVLDVGSSSSRTLVVTEV